MISFLAITAYSYQKVKYLTKLKYNNFCCLTQVGEGLMHKILQILILLFLIQRGIGAVGGCKNDLHGVRFFTKESSRALCMLNSA